MFGIANMTTFRHITRLIREQRAVDKEGKNVYMPNVEKLRGIRISLLQGALNGIFSPSGTQHTYEWLCQANGTAPYTRRVAQNYGHMDCLIGRDAARDVFPVILEELEKGDVRESKVVRTTFKETPAPPNPRTSHPPAPDPAAGPPSASSSE